MTPLQQAREALEKIAQVDEELIHFRDQPYLVHSSYTYSTDTIAAVVRYLMQARIGHADALAAIDAALAAPTPPADQVEVVRNTVTDKMVLAAYRVAIDPATPGPNLPITAIDRPALLACTRLMLEAALAASPVVAVKATTDRAEEPEDEIASTETIWPEWAKSVHKLLTERGAYFGDEDEVDLPDDLRAHFELCEEFDENRVRKDARNAALEEAAKACDDNAQAETELAELAHSHGDKVDAFMHRMLASESRLNAAAIRALKEG